MPWVLLVVLLVLCLVSLPPVGVFPQTYTPSAALGVVVVILLLLLLLGRI